MRAGALKYVWLTYRRETLWFPGAFLACFVVITWMMRRPDIRFSIARAYLGFFVPLIAGIMAAYAVLDDPALELTFATPTGGPRLLATRLGLILSVQALCAALFQLVAAGMAVELAPLGGAISVQLAWLVPTLALMSVATCGALASAQCVTGAFLAGAVWLLQLLMKGWVLTNGPHLYLFMGVLEPRRPELLPSQVALTAVSLALLAGSWALLRRQERYL